MVVDLNSTNPDGWENDVHVTVSNPTEASVWEVSVADFHLRNQAAYLNQTEVNSLLLQRKVQL